MVYIKLSSRSLTSIAAVSSGVVILMGWLALFLREFFSIKGTSFFNLMSESNLPTWFSSVLLLVAALLLSLCGVEQRRRKEPGGIYWFGMSAVFFAMSLDEAAMIHERINTMLLMVNADDLGSLATFPWVLPGLAVVLIFGAVFFRFYLTLPRRTKILFALAGTVYLGGGLFLEVVEGWVFSNPAHRGGILQSVIGALQESMEIAGIVIFIHALLKYLVVNSPQRTYTLETKIEK